MKKQAKSYSDRAWSFFGLLHACNQIRSEYYPLWLRNLSVSTSIGWFQDFVKTFFKNQPDLKYAPKRVQLEWSTGMDDTKYDRHDLTTILRTRAHSPTTLVEFVPYKLANNELQQDDICWFCINEMEAEEREEVNYENMAEECTCAPWDMPDEDWEPYQYGLIHRTDILTTVIYNDNPAWISDLRMDKITVEASFGTQAEPITFHIHCKDRFSDVGTKDEAATHAEDAWKLLGEWGLFEIEPQKEMAFTVNYEMEKKTKKGDREVISIERRTVRIGGLAPG